ncbi:transcription factor WEREWOLF, putative [Entamoeba dispar SAW760]|uniref:Transcription factor WEREWOLF, putative n=1 Tax=Entamoeba dispar (strain ATCC PRA-260 / SAW760) TaxID=370354 RepID=B0EDE5_ENTDS|nr:transcription factor WEREWOLF, putative [Entamoeba dispar SAW760]EDR27562.1 transcription factor WEREWOLF, putative [Entamoeba dispar SAW760]|eukprot:EDR27562.1 transcription factor WEREWOLF, putative [Entamoeba dispar SAW760]
MCYEMNNSSKTRENTRKKQRRPAQMWTAEEDDLLLQGVKTYGINHWKDVSSMVLGRTRKQCRERYFNHLDNGIKKKAFWSIEEDRIIVKLQKEIGNRWTEISKYLPGRAPNSVKNRYFSALFKNQTTKTENDIHKGEGPKSVFKPVDRHLYDVM